MTWTSHIVMHLENIALGEMALSARQAISAQPDHFDTPVYKLRGLDI